MSLKAKMKVLKGKFSYQTLMSNTSSAAVSNNLFPERVSSFVEWFTCCQELDDDPGFIHENVEYVFNESSGVHVRFKKHVTKDQIASMKGQTIIAVPHARSLSSVNLAPDWREACSTLEPRLKDAVFLMVQRKLPLTKSFWRAYLDLLPTTIDNPDDLHWNQALSILHTPLWWTEMQLKWLEGTPIYTWLQSKRVDWEDLWAKLLSSPVRAKFEKEGWTLTKQDLFSALSMFASRAFPGRFAGQTSETPHSILYPGIDMLNHSPHTKNYWTRDCNDFKLILMDEPGVKGEIYNPYGPKSNDELLASYGFVLEDNPFDSIIMKLRKFPLSSGLAFKVQDTKGTPETEHAQADAGERPPWLDPIPQPISEPEPSMTPAAQDWTEGAFHIREPSSTTHVLGYPQKHGMSVPASTDRLEYLKGIPISLIYTLFTLSRKGIPQANVSHNATSPDISVRTLSLALGTLLSDDTPNFLAMVQDLLRWLEAQMRSIKATEPLEAPIFERYDDVFAKRYHAQVDEVRYGLAQTYRKSVARVISANIDALQERLMSSTAGYHEVVKLPQILRAIETAPEGCRAAGFCKQLREVLGDMGIENWEQLHGLNIESHIWIMVVRFLLHPKLFINHPRIAFRIFDEQSKKDPKTGAENLFMARWLAMMTNMASEFHDVDRRVEACLHVDGEEGDLESREAFEMIESLLERLRSRWPDEDENRFWTQSAWDRDSICWCIAFFSRSSMEIVLRTGSPESADGYTSFVGLVLNCARTEVKGFEDDMTARQYHRAVFETAKTLQW